MLGVVAGEREEGEGEMKVGVTGVRELVEDAGMLRAREDATEELERLREDSAVGSL